jgi:hypothetical protein
MIEFTVLSLGMVIAGIFFWLGRRNLRKRRTALPVQEATCEQIGLDPEPAKRGFKKAVLIDGRGTAHHSHLPSIRSLHAACSHMRELSPTYDPTKVTGFCSKCRYRKGDWDLRLEQ